MIREINVKVRINKEERQVIDKLKDSYYDQLGIRVNDSDILRSGLKCLWEKATNKEDSKKV